MKSPPPAVSLRLPPAALLLCAAVLGYLPRLPPETVPPACRAAVLAARYGLPPAVSLPLCLPFSWPALPACRLHLIGCLRCLQ